MTLEEIKVLTEYQKQVFMTKEDGRDLEVKIDKIQNTMDSFIKKTTDNTNEISILNHRLKNTENWIDQASPKLGIEFKH